MYHQYWPQDTPDHPTICFKNGKYYDRKLCLIFEAMDDDQEITDIIIE